MKSTFSWVASAKILGVLIITGAVSMCIGTVFAYAEVITDFNSSLQIQTNGNLHVTEMITYDPQGVAHHGIYRDIILKNAQGHSIEISNISVTDEQGNAYQFVKSGLTTLDIKIGDPNTTFTTPKTYVISYDVRGAYSYFNSFDELYWNTTGNTWGFPIQRAEATVILPNDVNALQSSCYYGTSGSTNRCQVINNGNQVAFVSPSPLSPGQQMTVATDFPKGIVPVVILSNPTIVPIVIGGILGLLVLLITIFILYSKWNAYGRDPKNVRTIIPEYDVPENMTPLEVAMVLNENIKSKDISAEIIYLATKGYLKIEVGEHQFLSFKKDYIFNRVGTTVPPTVHDALLLDFIFPMTGIARLSDLKNKFYRNIPKIKNSVSQTVTEKGYFVADPVKVQQKFAGAGMVMLILSTIAISFIAVSLLKTSFFIGFGVIGLLVGLGISGLITALFSKAMIARTQHGLEIRNYILGLKEYLQIAEKDRINFANAPEKKPETFEKFLPYAMILGVEKAWAKEFEGIYTTPPNWYHDPSMSGFNTAVFVSSLNSFSTIATTSLASSPGGGAGAAGGGGGGGGGGSW